ncbi:MAG TPA: PAS-domain containing protein [Pedomonas sp.]|uniref:PAS domain-containing sensor histidine kinase n=1 Tax=Pedomonas sp. TaxID=2976421 RepID=UPI002F41F98C
MSTPETWKLALAATVAAAWLVVAVWAVIRGSNALLSARVTARWGRRLHGLLSTSPAAYLIVGADGATTCSDTLRSWLGIDRQVTRLEELEGRGQSGLEMSDYAQLVRDIDALALSARPFQRLVTSARRDRQLLVEGRAAPMEVAGDAGVVVWFFDATTTQSALDQLRGELDGTRRELEALRALVQAAPLPMWRRDRDLKLCDVNAAYVDAVEAASAKDVVQQGIELVGNVPGTVPAQSAERARDLDTAQVHQANVILYGHRRTLQIYDIPLGEAGVGGFALDITEREEARAELARHTQAQNETLDRLSSGVVIFGPDMTLFFHNKAFSTLFALEPEWLEDRPSMGEVLERMREKHRLPEQRDFPEWKRRHLGWFTTALEPLEETWVLPDETVLRVIAQPHPIGGLLLAFEDYTEELSLRSTRDTLIKVQAATLNNLYEAVAVFGPSGRLELHNTRFATLWQCPPDLLSEQPHVDRLAAHVASRLDHSEQAQLLRDGVLRAAEGRNPSTGRFRLVDHQIIDYAAVPLPDGNALVTFIDVTATTNMEKALRERNEALEAADRLKSQFVANVSYELRTPLTSIIGFAEMLDQGYFGGLNERQLDYVHSILTSSNRLMVLINDMLDLAVIEAGALVLDIAPVRIEPMVAAVVQMVEEQARARTLHLSQMVDPSAGIVEGDERRLKQVLYNLLSNSIRFTPPGGNVAVRAWGDETRLMLEVTDTGVGTNVVGMSATERFRRNDGDADTAPGIGLGLSLVRRFVAMHGGTVELSSEDAGTRVLVHLARKAPVEPPPASE